VITIKEFVGENVCGLRKFNIWRDIKEFVKDTFLIVIVWEVDVIIPVFILVPFTKREN
jgi:hypothetical protein